MESTHGQDILLHKDPHLAREHAEGGHAREVEQHARCRRGGEGAFQQEVSLNQPASLGLPADAAHEKRRCLQQAVSHRLAGQLLACDTLFLTTGLYLQILTYASQT